MEDHFLTDLIPLTKKEEARRKELETKIFTTVRQFYVDLGATLNEILEKRLYKSTHHTFAEYSSEILDMAKRTAYQYIQAYEVVQNLSAIADKNDSENVRNCAQNAMQLAEITIPANEGQARALAGLTPDEQREAWVKAVGCAPNGKVTAAHVRSIVRAMKGADTTQKVEKAKRLRQENKSRISESFQMAFNGFLAAVQEEIDNNWKNTDRLTVVRHLDGIRGAISENGNHRIPEHGYAIEASNLEKLTDAGFSIYRANTTKFYIEKYLHSSEWSVTGTYDDAKATTAALEELLLDTNTLRG